MKQIVYSLIVKNKLKKLKQELTENYGLNVSVKVIKQITESVRTLEVFEKRGISVTDMYGIECDYRYLYIGHNYLFYRIEKEQIVIVELFEEKEDFMWKLFGIETTPQSTYDYWEE